MWYRLSAGDLETKFRTNIERGLDDAQSARRLKEEGPNAIPEAKTESLFLIFVRQFSSPLIFILIVASAVVWALGDASDALVIFIVLAFNAIIGAIQEGKARNTLTALKQFIQTTATVMRQGKETILPDTELVVGDLIALQEGEKVPADARIIESFNLAIDEAALTGESHPTHKHAEILTGKNLPISEQANMVFKGTYVVSGNARAIITETGINTVIGKISNEISLIDTEIPLKANIRYLSRLIMATVAIIVSSLFVIGILAGKSALEMFRVSVSLTVSIIPEGLPVVLTIVLATGVYRMAKRNALVKRLHAVEALGQARVIAVDKTGTITKNEMVVKKLYIGNALFDVSGVGYEPHGEIRQNDEAVDPLNHPELLLAGKIAAFSANARIAFVEKTNTFKVTGDPTEAALLVFAQKIGFHKQALESESPKIGEIPFDYQAKYHATSHQVGDKQFIAVAGAPEVVLLFCKHIMKEGRVAELGHEARNLINDNFLQMSSDGLRVIACAMAELPLGKQFTEHNHLPALTLVGLVGMQDALRDEVTASIRQAQGAGVTVVLITGDHKVTATALAKEAGIYTEGNIVLTGNDIASLSDDALADVISKTTVFARVTPDDKLRIIQAYKKKGQVVAMTGDGINDAPSLVAADLGVAMGRTGTEVAKEASDIILLDDNFTSIVAAIEEGRSIYKTIKKVILYLFSTSIGEVLTIGGAIVLGYPLPLLAAQIIWLNLVTDGFLTVALAMEPKEKGLLDSSFEHPKKYLIDQLTVWRMFVMALPMMIGSLFLFDSYFQYDLAKAMTIALTVLAVFQWLNAWNCRYENESLFKTNPFSNLYLIGATVIVILLQLMAVYAPFMQQLLKTVPLSAYEWSLIAIVATLIVAAEEIRKAVARMNIRARTRHA